MTILGIILLCVGCFLAGGFCGVLVIALGVAASMGESIQDATERGLFT